MPFRPNPFPFKARALGDLSVTVEEVTPPVFHSGSLFPVEGRIVQFFEENTYSVVNIFDVTLRPQLKVTGVVEVPEGNGSGVVWDGQRHIVTNYHGKFVGADRAKDLAVLNGGPLLDSKGTLIGINTAIFTQTGTSAGVGFAIPSSTVIKIVPQLIQFGKVVRAGLNMEIAPDLVASQLTVWNGALILQVPGNSLAAKAGLLPTTRGFAGNIILGDVIVAVDDK